MYFKYLNENLKMKQNEYLQHIISFATDMQKNTNSFEDLEILAFR